jgi:phosphate-selective porin OprO/OprP
MMNPGGMGDPMPGAAPSAPPATDPTLSSLWRDGLRFESKDKDFSIFVGGRVHFDVVDYLATDRMRRAVPGNVPLEDGVTFRRVRFATGGTAYRNFEYLAEIDFFNGFVTSIAENRLSNVVAPTDLWVMFKDLPYVGNLRIGNQKPLYSFEHLTSSRFLNFVERSLGFDAFAENFNNGFAPGVAVFNNYADRRGLWGVGLFKTTRSVFGWNVGRHELEVNGRLTYLPVYEEEGKYLVHVGLGGAHRELDDGQFRSRARFDARNSPSAFAPLVADTGLVNGDSQQLLIPEFVVVAGPLSFQAEYYASWVNGVAPPGVPFAPRGTAYLQSAYAEVHWFLTGEHRDYNRNTGAFWRVVPKRPFAWNKCGFTGPGAWQLTARYSYLDLTDGFVNGGRVHDMTLGVNWFWNPNMKIQFNYFLADRDVANPAGNGVVHGFAARTAFDF